MGTEFGTPVEPGEEFQKIIREIAWPGATLDALLHGVLCPINDDPRRQT
jgi:hypothetical protein